MLEKEQRYNSYSLIGDIITYAELSSYIPYIIQNTISDNGMNLPQKKMSYDYCRVCRNEKFYFDCKDCLEQNGCDWTDIRHRHFPKRGAHCWCSKPC